MRLKIFMDNLIGEGGILAAIIKKGKPLSLILWGPPGSGKTTIARLYAQAFSIAFASLSAVFSGVADLKKLFNETYPGDLPVMLFVDEIHRFNKAQQDAFLPYLENGKLILVGATVENPSFYLNKALLSRVRVLKLNYLDEEALEKILVRYENTEGAVKDLTDEVRRYLIFLAHGDGRYLLNLLENVESAPRQYRKNVEKLQQFLQKRAPFFDKENDEHYNLISALHKSVRGSDPDASLYWLSRILLAGEEPLFVARRLIRMAAEDVGLAEPEALQLAIVARDAYEMLGSPEGELALAEVVVYLALAPKSNAIYTAFSKAQEVASDTHHLPPPDIILNAPTSLMRQMGYGKGYIYDHALPEGFSGQNYFPQTLGRQTFYHPTERGREGEMKKHLHHLRKLREKNQ